jgi:N-methylhydantoinase A/oxoprolinase/acetone carboxylase beta subunit
MMSKNASPGPLVLGIDTGGTYTDGVLMEYQSRHVLATHKSLTTKRDLSIGIERVIEGIHIEDPSAIKMVSISTTLATNAIAEGKGKRVALLLIGYDPELVTLFKLDASFATPNYYYFTGGHDLYGREKAPLDLPAILAKVTEIKGQVDALAVSSYFSPLNPEHENRVQAAVSGICDLPIVLGHQLSTKLGSVERATTAAINASLLAVLQDFIIAVQRAMECRKIEAPLMVVRGDGTLMSEEFAARTPVETIHSGPAASAIGGRFLSQQDNALVIDVGGTTTDLALIVNGEVTVSEEGATVSGYKTSVQAAHLLSIALGGDSHIAFNREREVAIGPERVTPLAYLSTQFPQVGKRLQALVHRGMAQVVPDWLDYWYLLREPTKPVETAQEKALVELLRDGPQPTPEIVKVLKVPHIGLIDVKSLLRQEIIGKAGLTPTDLLHREGRYTPWDVETALNVWEIFARCQYQDPEELRQRLWRKVTEIILGAVVGFLNGRRMADIVPNSFAPGAEPWSDASFVSASGSLHTDDLAAWFFYNSVYGLHPHLSTSLHLSLPIIGIGAPAEFFLKDVAEVLHTELILPDHYPVANALGAVAGSVMVAEEVLVYPQLSTSGLEVLGFYVQTSDGRQAFEEEGEALAHARSLSQERALGAALRSGADNPQVVVEEVSDGLDTYRVRAKAMGNPRLSGTFRS